MTHRSHALAIALLAAAATASSALAAHPTPRFSVTAQGALTSRHEVQSVKPAMPAGATAAARAKEQEAKGYLTPMPW